MKKHLIDEISDKDFDTRLKREDDPVVVYFYSPEVHLSTSIYKEVSVLQENFRGIIKFFAINISDNKDIAYRFRIFSLPAFLYFKNGVFSDKIADIGLNEDIQARLRALVGTDVFLSSPYLYKFDSAHYKTALGRTEKPLLLNFWINGAELCWVMAEDFIRLAKVYRDSINISIVDLKDNRDLATHLRISSVPTLVVIKNGEIIKKHIGVLTKNDIEKIILKAIAHQA